MVYSIQFLAKYIINSLKALKQNELQLDMSIIKKTTKKDLFIYLFFYFKSKCINIPPTKQATDNMKM